MSGQDLPKSVLLVLHVENHSGPQRSLTPRLQDLRKQGVRVTTLVPRSGAALEYARPLGDVARGMPGALLVPRSLRAFLGIAGAVWRQARSVEKAVQVADADLVIVSSARMPGALIGARRAGVASLLYAGETLSGPLRYRLMGEVVGRLAAQLSGAIVVPSRVVGRWYEARGGRPHLVHPPIGISPDPEDRRRRGLELRQNLEVGPSEALVTSLGAITRGRGQDVLIRALALERARGKSWRLVIGGEPYTRPSDIDFAEKLRRLPAELGVEDAVIFAGRIDDAAALYAASDVFVNPARIPESFGRASCEALAADCPVVTTRVGGVVEALRPDETALFVQPDDTTGMGEAVTRLIEDKELSQRIAARGRADVEERFAPGVEAPRFEVAVREAMSTRKRTAGLRRLAGRQTRHVHGEVRSLAILHLADVCGPFRSLEEELRWLAGQGSMDVLLPGTGRLESRFGAFASVRSYDYAALTMPQGAEGWSGFARGFARDVAMFRQAIRDARPDLVLITSVVLPAASLAARIEGVPSVLYAGEILDEPRVDSRPRALAGRAVIGLGGRLATAIITCSKRVRRQYAGFDDKVTTINPPIDRRYAEGDGTRFRRAHDIPADAPLILAVGALSHGRGQDVIIRALSRVHESHPKALIAIVGDAHPRDIDRAYERELIRLAADVALGSIIFAGFTEKVEDAYAAADVVVNPARYEAFGRVAFEALAAGRPVVSTTAGGIPDVLRDGRDALLIPPGQPAELGEAISVLLAEPDLVSRLVASGRERVATDLEPAEAMARFQGVIATVLGERLLREGRQ